VQGRVFRYFGSSKDFLGGSNDLVKNSDLLHGVSAAGAGTMPFQVRGCASCHGDEMVVRADAHMSSDLCTLVRAQPPCATLPAP
jgi:hypothetical protein